MRPISLRVQAMDVVFQIINVLFQINWSISLDKLLNTLSASFGERFWSTPSFNSFADHIQFAIESSRIFHEENNLRLVLLSLNILILLCLLSNLIVLKVSSIASTGPSKNCRYRFDPYIKAPVIPFLMLFLRDANKICCIISLVTFEASETYIKCLSLPSPFFLNAHPLFELLRATHCLLYSWNKKK